jgi:poly-gamma-glutamate capsule biosynthesis protein CapA/YwtB (metallophosphatase superfamily)
MWTRSFDRRLQWMPSIPSVNMTTLRPISPAASSRLQIHAFVRKICGPALTAALVLSGVGSLLAETKGETALTVTAVGDVRITRELARDHSAEIRRIKLRGDLVFANFEGVFDDSSSVDPWKFSVPVTSMPLLREVGFTTLSLANNHSLDLGKEGYRKTDSLLQRDGFWAVEPEGSGTVATTKNRRVRVIGFSFGTENNINDLDAIPAAIGRKRGEIVIVSAHMGGENSLGHLVPNGMEYFGDERRGNVVEFSHRCIDAGADLVLGHGPHVPRGIELYKNKLIVYSLGNFVFDYPGAGRNRHAPGYSITVNLNDSGDFQSAHIDSYDLQQGVPVLESNGRAYEMIRKLTLGNLKQTSLRFPGKGLVVRSR